MTRVRDILLAVAVLLVQVVLAVPVGDPSRTYAILVNGGSRQKSNHVRFWGDMSLAYCALRLDCKVPKENITLLWASGDPTGDMCTQLGFCSQCQDVKPPVNPYDFDRDGVGDVDGPATLERIGEAFAQMSARLKDGDQLFVFFSDHGSRSTLDFYVDYALAPFSTVNLWQGDLLADWKLAEWTKDIPCPVIFALDCCYSGGIMADVMRSPAIRFAASADGYETSLAGNTLPYYCQWAYHFFSALRGYYPGSAFRTDERAKACNADVDGDGSVSFREAARYAYRKRCDKDYPQYAESWPRCGTRLFLAPQMDADGFREYARKHASERWPFQGIRRAYSLQFRKGAVSPEATDSLEFEHEPMTLAAPSTTVDKKGNVKEFQRWVLTPATVDMGPDFSVTSPETHFAMPGHAVTIAPEYMDAGKGCRITMYARADRTGDGDTDAFQWSPDGKCWYKAGTSAFVAAGSHSVRWKSFSPAWVAPTARSKIKLAAGEFYENAERPAIFTYVPKINARVMALKDGEWVSYDNCGTVKGLPKDARAKAGTKVSIRAVAEKGFVFTTWEREDEAVPKPYASSYSFRMPSNDVNVVAAFVTSGYDADSIALTMDGHVLQADKESAWSTNVMCGVAVNWPVVGSAASTTTVTVKGLPSGLQLKQDRKTGEYAITGTPQSASKTNKNGVQTPSTIKLTVSTAGKNKKTHRVYLTVRALPPWAYGSFSGYAALDEMGTKVGTSSLTVTSVGRSSGRFSTGGDNWSYSISSYARFDDSDSEADQCFVIEGTAKASKRTCPFRMLVRPGERYSGSSTAFCQQDGLFILMGRNVWKDKSLGVVPIIGKYTLADQGYPEMTAKFASTGNIAFAGVLDDGTRVNSSALGFLDVENAVKAYLIVPADKKSNGFLDVIKLNNSTKEK